MAEVVGLAAGRNRALLDEQAKRFGVRPVGWEQSAGPFADETPRSVADIDGPDALVKVRADESARRDVLQIVELFRAKVADVGCGHGASTNFT